MKKPVIFAVDSDLQGLEAVNRELHRRYAEDYQIACESSPQEALRKLEAFKAAGEDVAVILAGSWLIEMTCSDFLLQAHHFHPDARRGLLIQWGDQAVKPQILQAITFGLIDAYGSKPVVSPDEDFHRMVTRFLQVWAQEHRPGVQFLRVIGEQWSRRAYELRDLLNRNGIPFGFVNADSPEGKAMLVEAGFPEGPFPVVIFLDGKALAGPSNTEIAHALDISTIFDLRGLPEGGPVADVTIVGAGPAGLSAAVYSASEGLSTVVIEREAIGGQAGTSSRIRNYLGFPMGIAGGDLAARAYQQAWLFGANFTFTQEATGLRVDGDERAVILSDGTEIPSRTVVLAMGVSYRRLDIPELEKFIGAGVFYGASGSEALAMRGQQVYVIGAGNSAGQAALHLASYADRVTIVVRGASLASSMSDYLIREIEAKGNIELCFHTKLVSGGGDYRLRELVLEDVRSGATETVPAGALFVTIGAKPHTGWLPPEIQRDTRGYIMTGENLLKAGAFPPGWTIPRRPMLFETNLPGVFAVGDVRHRSVKRVASAVGEGSIAISLIHQYLTDRRG